jgi:hypothetical protein
MGFLRLGRRRSRIVGILRRRRGEEKRKGGRVGERGGNKIE